MNIAVILLSGKGTRMGNDVPKQFLTVNNKLLFLYAVNAFYNHPKIDKLLLVTNEEHVNDVKKYLANFKKKPIQVIAGGKERYLSVKKAIEALNSLDYQVDDKILIHDGVRPNVSERIISENIRGLNIEPCALTAIKAPDDYNPTERVDTIHLLHNQKYRAQTPQSFRLGILRDIYKRGENYDPYPFTDDISLAIACNYPYIIVGGDENNYKITTQEDLERFIKSQK